MNEAILSFAKELTKLVARDRAGRGAPLVCPPGEWARAAEIFAPLRKIAIVSGFFVPGAGAPETDGPGGAAVLARAFLSEGRACEIWTDERCIAVTRACATAAGCGDAVRVAPQSLREDAPDGLIFVERLGRASDGKYYSCKKRDITEWTAPLDALAEEAAALGIRTAGIGDGGNEVGMGNYLRELASALPGYAHCLSVVRVESALAADVSNWGAYALAAALSCLWGRWRGAEPGDERRMLKAAYDAGAVDGISGKCELSVDGFSVGRHEEMISDIKRLWLAHAQRENY